MKAPRQAMVLAAGRGERMRPLTDDRPKPLVEVAGRALIDRALDRLQEAGVRRAVVNTSYKAEILETHLAKRSEPEIVFSREAEPLETGGGVARALPLLGPDPFFLVNGDIVWLDGPVPALKHLADAWSDDLDALFLVHPTPKAIGFGGAGDFFLTAQGGISRRGSADRAPYVYCGVTILHPRLFAGAPEGVFSLNLLYDRALAKNPPRIRALIHDGEWLHIGDPKGKEEAEAYLNARAG